MRHEAEGVPATVLQGSECSSVVPGTCPALVTVSLSATYLTHLSVQFVPRELLSVRRLKYQLLCHIMIIANTRRHWGKIRDLQRGVGGGAGMDSLWGC